MNQSRASRMENVDAVHGDGRFRHFGRVCGVFSKKQEDIPNAELSRERDGQVE